MTIGALVVTAATIETLRILKEEKAKQEEEKKITEEVAKELQKGTMSPFNVEYPDIKSNLEANGLTEDNIENAITKALNKRHSASNAGDVPGYSGSIINPSTDNLDGPLSKIPIDLNLNLQPKIMGSGNSSIRGNTISVPISPVKSAAWNGNLKRWAELPENSGGTVQKDVGIQRSGFATIADWLQKSFMGGNVSKGVGILRNGFSTISSWLTGNYMGGGVSKAVGIQRSGFSTIGNWLNSNYMGGEVSKAVGVRRSGFNTIQSWISGNYMGSGLYKNVGLQRSSKWTVFSWIANNYMGAGLYKNVGLQRNGWNTVTGWANDYYRGKDLAIPVTLNANGIKVPGGTLYTMATGGSIANGKINRYASGTLNAHGTMFIAGEAGPEIVGNINGRTEVLNRSQIAATMYNAINSAMRAYGDGGSSRMDASLAEQNALLRRQNELLTAILEKDNTVEVTASAMMGAFSRKNQRDGRTIIPIGN